jgi:hypothetical protein
MLSPTPNIKTAINIQGIDVNEPFTGLNRIKADGTINTTSNTGYAMEIKNEAIPR